MRHRRAGKRLNRNTHQRKALFKNLIAALILHGRIKTSEAKAKAIKPLIDRLISKARAGTVHVRRQLLAFLPGKEAAHKLVDEIAPRFTQQGGGFTKLVRVGRRKGDNTMVVELSLTSKATDIKSEKKQVKKVAGKES